MKIEIENLRAKMSGARLNIYQRADAKKEFNRLLNYVNELEQLTIPVVVRRSEQLFCGDLIKHNFSLSKIGRCITCDREKDKAK